MRRFHVGSRGSLVGVALGLTCLVAATVPGGAGEAEAPGAALEASEGGLRTGKALQALLRRVLGRRGQRRAATGSGGGLSFACADPDGTGEVNLSDAVYILNYLFRGGRDPQCAAECSGNITGRVTRSGTGLEAHVWALPRDPETDLTGDAEGPFSTDADGNYCIDVGSVDPQLPPGEYVLVATSVAVAPAELDCEAGADVVAVGVYDADDDGSSRCPQLRSDVDDFRRFDEQSSLTGVNIELCELCVRAEVTVPANLDIVVGVGTAAIFVPGTNRVEAVWDFLWKVFTGDENGFRLCLPAGPQYLISAGALSLREGGFVSGFYDGDRDGSNNCDRQQPTTGDLVQPGCGELQAGIDDLCRQ